MAKNYTIGLYATIASSATTSDAIPCDGSKILLSLLIPAAFTGTTITFQVSQDGTTYAPLYNEGTAYSISVGTSRLVALSRQVFDGVRYVKIVSNAGGGEAATRQIYYVIGE